MFALQLTQDQNTLFADQVQEDKVSFPNLNDKRAALNKHVLLSILHGHTWNIGASYRVYFTKIFVLVLRRGQGQE